MCSLIRALAANHSKAATVVTSRSVLPTARDEPRGIILVACGKCDWTAAFSRDDLIASHGADCPMPNLLSQLASTNEGRPALGSLRSVLPRAHRRPGATIRQAQPILEITGARGRFPRASMRREADREVREAR
jgi:hypothetical protein